MLKDTPWTGRRCWFTHSLNAWYEDGGRTLYYDAVTQRANPWDNDGLYVATQRDRAPGSASITLSSTRWASDERPALRKASAKPVPGESAARSSVHRRRKLQRQMHAAALAPHAAAHRPLVGKAQQRPVPRCLRLCERL